LFTEEKRVSLYQTNNFLSRYFKVSLFLLFKPYKLKKKKKLESSIFWAVNKYIAFKNVRLAFVNVASIEAYFGFAMGDNFLFLA
jgi:hypothetical protein